MNHSNQVWQTLNFKHFSTSRTSLTEKVWSYEVTKFFRLLSMLLYLLFKLIVIDFNEVILKYIKIYYSSFFFTHLYITKKLHSEIKSSLYTETCIFDTYIFGTWSVNPFCFLFFCLFNWLIIGVIKCGKTRIKPSQQRSLKPVRLFTTEHLNSTTEHIFTTTFIE